MTSRNVSNFVPADPPYLGKLFTLPAFAWLWLVVRIYLGVKWIESGWGKLTNPAWMETGEALKGFWAKAVAIPDAPARPLIAFDWYRGFLEGMLDSGTYSWFAKLIASSELIIGVALILGIYTGLFALLGGFMNWNFIMAGSASVNGVFLVLSILLVLAWKIAGLVGLDRWILPLIGTPWQKGKLFQKKF
ncbi:MAG TPA: DoxX family membrane protein [Anaerolineales bacterium]|nr:DoxX family membrane protein [Anaerolineales bacterium]